MQTTILKIVFLVTLFFGITSLGIARTMDKNDIPLKGDHQEEQKRSTVLPIPINASISNNQLILDFLSSLGDVMVTVGSESGSIHSINYSITSAQIVILTLDNVAIGEECQIELVTLDGKRYWGNFIMK